MSIPRPVVRKVIAEDAPDTWKVLIGSSLSRLATLLPAATFVATRSAIGSGTTSAAGMIEKPLYGGFGAAAGAVVDDVSDDRRPVGSWLGGVAANVAQSDLAAVGAIAGLKQPNEAGEAVAWVGRNADGLDVDGLTSPRLDSIVRESDSSAAREHGVGADLRPRCDGRHPGTGGHEVVDAEASGARKPRGSEQRRRAVGELDDAPQQRLGGNTKTGSEIKQVREREVVRLGNRESPSRHQQLGGSNVAQALQLPVVAGALGRVAVARTLGVVRKQEVPDLVCDREAHPRGAARRIEFDSRATLY